MQSNNITSNFYGAHIEIMQLDQYNYNKKCESILAFSMHLFTVEFIQLFTDSITGIMAFINSSVTIRPDRISLLDTYSLVIEYLTRDTGGQVQIPSDPYYFS